MRKLVTLISAAVVAVTTAATAGVPQANAADSASSTREAKAISAAKSHAGATEFGAGQALQATSTLVDPDGTTHVRMNRTYRGLEVVGGDLVVHQSRAGAWKGSSLTLDESPRPRRGPRSLAGRSQHQGEPPPRATTSIDNVKLDGSTLVVDASGASPRLAWRVMSGGTQTDGTPSRLASFVDAKTGSVIRTEQEIVRRRRHRQHPLQRHRPAAAHPVGVDVPAQGPDPRQHVHDRPEQQGGLLPLPGLRLGLQDRDPVHQQHHQVRQRHDQQPGLRRCGRAVRHERHLGLLQGRPRPQRHLRHRQGLVQPGALRQELRQRLLGRHQDDVRRR